MGRPVKRTRLSAYVVAVAMGAVFLQPLAATAAPSPQEKAAAEALFQQATVLMDGQDYARACTKFEGSQELDPALGTMLRLADCYDRVGRSASAWALFREAAAAAVAAAQPEREQIALERAQDLETRLATVTLNVAAEARVPGLQVRLNGALIPAASWNAALPVDPGPQLIEAFAPHHEPWSTKFEVSPGPSARKVEVPGLSRTLEPSPAAPNASPGVGAERERSNLGSTLRTAGYVTAGVGVAGLALAGFFAYRAYDLNQDSLEQCRSSDPNACTPLGKSLRDDARSNALTSTITVAASGALLATGLTLILSAPSQEVRKPSRAKLRLRTSPTARGARLLVEGRF